jgi:hypothetical protein
LLCKQDLKDQNVFLVILGVSLMSARERWKFFRTCNRICKYAALPIAAVSIVLLITIAQSILNPTQPFLPKPFPLIVGISIGILNIITGLLLLTKE